MNNDASQQTPAPSPQLQQSSALATGALILGISSLLIPVIGIATGIAAIIMGSKAKQQGHRGSAVAGQVTGVIGLVFNVLITGLFVLMSFVFVGSPPWGSAETRAYDAQVAEKKDYTINETIHIGSIDMTITTVTRNYSPSEVEKTDNPPDSISSFIKQSDRGKLTTANEEYVLIEGTVSPNGKTTVAYSERDLLLLNDYPYASTTGAYGLWGPKPRSNQTPPHDFRAVYRIEKGSEKLTLSYYTTIYRSVSPIVGTEGAGGTDQHYTIVLN